MADRFQNWLLSGGIGSGKSIVGGLLTQAGILVIDADPVGHEVLGRGGAAVGAVGERWPEVVDHREINREALAAIVFADQEQLTELETITHPHIFEILERRIAGESSPVVVEIPLLIQPFADRWPRIVVDAPDPVRLERSIARGQIREDVLRRMAMQPARAEWLGVADLVIPNQGTLEDLEQAVARVVPVIVGRNT